MNLIAGRALVTDFDGTLTELDVDWEALRRGLRIHRIAELWSRGAESFAPLTRAEVDGARSGVDHDRAIAFTRAFVQFAVLTDNSELAVEPFFERHQDLHGRCVRVVGRESLGGSKHDRSVFRRGADLCISALGVTARECVYLGDHPGELEHAGDFGFEVVDAASLR